MKFNDSDNDDLKIFDTIENKNDSEEIRIIKNLISSVQGAPFPQNINNQLYTIWYEHAMKAISEAYSYVSRNDGYENDIDSVDIP